MIQTISEQIAVWQTGQAIVEGLRRIEAGGMPAAEPNGEKPEYGPGEEPRPREGEPTRSAHGELL